MTGYTSHLDTSLYEFVNKEFLGFSMPLLYTCVCAFTRPTRVLADESTHCFPCIPMFAPSPTLEYNTHTTSVKSGKPTKDLLLALGVDFRSCEYIYDPIGFMNRVHPLLPRLISMLPGK